ncbi:Uncharacterised protein [Mycobacteroides abscessus subsp. abscessus]|nr:Uncharacterised protein [Mycobacteroides abscessus subsp. abscessus]
MPAATANSRVCSPTPSTETRISGWMPGTRWLTLPKSVEAASTSETVPPGYGSRPRRRWASTHRSVSGPLERTGRVAGASSHRTCASTPAIIAAPRSTCSTRADSSARVSGSWERTYSSICADSVMMFGWLPPSVITAWMRSVGGVC